MKYYQIKGTKRFIGRKVELQSLAQLRANPEASLMVVYGRRRIGKTALIEKAFENDPLLKFEGLEEGDQGVQIQHFLDALANYAEDPKIARLEAKNWKTAFLYLAEFTKKNRVILYFEELQWMANYKHDLISDLKYVWDNHFSHNEKLKLILCGSSPSYMVNSVITSKALYNRSQWVIHLNPFSFSETKEYIQKERPLQELMDLYLTVGGVPEYLKYFNTSGSIYAQLLNLHFRQTNPLFNEPDRIFQSSLSSDKSYKEIINYLSLQKVATREEISKALGLQGGGYLTKQLTELELTELISKLTPFNLAEKSKLVKFEISDAYLQFYFKFVKSKLHDIKQGRFNDHPERALNLETYRKWLGFSFERWCRNHHFIISDRLGFGAIEYASGSYFNRAIRNEDLGAQIDLLFDRKDKTISVCEIKYIQGTISKSIMSEMDLKIDNLRNHYLKNKKRSIEKVLITSGEVPKSIKESHYFDRILLLEDLF